MGLGFKNPTKENSYLKSAKPKIAKPVIAFPDFTDESPPDLDWQIVKDIAGRFMAADPIGCHGNDLQGASHLCNL
ncbi:hypothetical protein B5D77_04305 [Microcystis sp. MC19]|uniref:hypothetical protein n=1 Tax=Microcystis TaxID=1125 RepID=UPI0002DFED07|nr:MULTISPECIES: hypothetical protein [Microcystis]AVQ70659.1 hypothetical protein B5D77_04305 [Microcystis sp. MC19]